MAQSKMKRRRGSIRTNRELVDIFGSENIVSVIQSARLRWAGHVIRMDDDRVAKNVLENRVDGQEAEEDLGSDGLSAQKKTSKNWEFVIGKQLLEKSNNKCEIQMKYKRWWFKSYDFTRSKVFAKCIPLDGITYIRLS